MRQETRREAGFCFWAFAAGPELSSRPRFNHSRGGSGRDDEAVSVPSLVVPAKAGTQGRSQKPTWISLRLARDDAAVSVLYAVIPAKAGIVSCVKRHWIPGLATLARDNVAVSVVSVVVPAQAGTQGRSQKPTWIPGLATLARDDEAVSDRRDASRLALGQLRHILSIIACPNPEDDTCLAPCISRAKS